MKKLIVVSVAISLIILSVTGFYFTGNFVKSEPGKYDEFAQCLTGKGVMIFGADWCSHCKNQKEIFGSSFQFVNYVECDSLGQNANPQLCAQHPIQGYPTWLINGKYYPGEQSLQTLSYLSGCSLS